jgi:hypothetical protein
LRPREQASGIAWRLLTQDIATSNGVLYMADSRQPSAPTHRAYSVIKRDGQDDYWLNLGLVFPHKDGSGFNIILQARPDHLRRSRGKRSCRRSGAPEG